MKISFPKRVKLKSKNRDWSANAKFGGHVLENHSSQICRYIRIYTNMESSYPIHNP